MFASVAAVGACLACWSTSSSTTRTSDPRPAVLLLVGAASVYLLVLAGLHSLADRSLATAVPALVVVAVMWVIGLLGLEPGTSVLLLGLARGAQPRRPRTTDQPGAQPAPELSA